MCLMALPWLWVRRMLRLVVGLAGVWVTAAATVEFWSPMLSEEASFEPICWWLYRVFEQELYPRLGAWVHLDDGLDDGLVAFVGLHIAVLNRRIAEWVTPLVTGLLFLVVGSCVCVDIDPEAVRVKRWWGTQRIRRTGKMLTFRMVDPIEYYDKRYQPTFEAMKRSEAGRSKQAVPGNAPTIVEMLVGRQRHRLFTTRRADVAEALVFGLQAAFTRAEVEFGELRPDESELCELR